MTTRPTGETPDASSPPPRPSAAPVFKNTLLLVIAQAITMPLSVVTNAVMGRFIGPAEFGRLYLAQTFVMFGFLAVDWGQVLTLPGMIAKDRSRAGEALGSALLWRTSFILLVALVLCGVARFLGQSSTFITILLLVILTTGLTTLVNACLEAVRGFERTDIMAYYQVGSQLVGCLATVVTVVLGGHLSQVLIIQAVCITVGFFFVARTLRLVGIRHLAATARTLRALAVDGVPFVFFGLAMTLQPNVDALFMARLVPDEVIGWHAAARRLTGALLFPASAIVTALYPTLCRLFAEDKAAFARTASTAIRTTTVVAVPIALGCFLFPDLGIRIFSRASFSNAEDNLRIMAPFLFLLYFSMPLGCALLAGGKQRAWSVVQVLCVLFSLALDPLLIPWFQRRMHNGGLGVCTASLVSEAFMVLLGFWLAPRGIFNRLLAGQVGRAIAAGGAMVLVARVLGQVTDFVVAPLSVVAYGVCVWLIGGLDADLTGALREILGRKFARFRTS